LASGTFPPSIGPRKQSPTRARHPPAPSTAPAPAPSPPPNRAPLPANSCGWRKRSRGAPPGSGLSAASSPFGFGVFCFFLVWFGLVWFGLVWFGLVWFVCVLSGFEQDVAGCLIACSFLNPCDWGALGERGRRCQRRTKTASGGIPLETPLFMNRQNNLSSPPPEPPTSTSTPPHQQKAPPPEPARNEVDRHAARLQGVDQLPRARHQAGLGGVGLGVGGGGCVVGLGVVEGVGVRGFSGGRR
jgi:hypothetical protein